MVLQAMLRSDTTVVAIFNYVLQFLERLVILTDVENLRTCTVIEGC